MLDSFTCASIRHSGQRYFIVLCIWFRFCLFCFIYYNYYYYVCCCVLQYTVRDAGYTATDQALRQVQNSMQCKWLSVTNGDNVYGSNVIARVLGVQPLHQTGKLPDLFLSPLDSRNYLDQGIMLLINSNTIDLFLLF